MLKNPSMTVTPPHRSSLPVDLISNAKYRMKLRAHKSFALKCRYRPDRFFNLFILCLHFQSNFY